MTLDSQYRKEKYDRVEDELPYLFISLRDSWPFFRLIGLIALLLAIVIPFLPPLKHGSFQDWHFPRSFSEYFEQMEDVGWLYLIVITWGLLQLTFVNVRVFIDRKFGYKKVATLAIIALSISDNYKTLTLSNKQKLKVSDDINDYAILKEGQVLEIQKTATNKLLWLKIIQNC